MYSKAKWHFNEEGEVVIEHPTTKPKRKPDFSKHRWFFFMEEGIMWGSYEERDDPDKRNICEHFVICQLTGLLMFWGPNLEGQKQEWDYLDDDFQEAYRKWAKKQAEKVLLESKV